MNKTTITIAKESEYRKCNHPDKHNCLYFPLWNGEGCDNCIYNPDRPKIEDNFLYYKRKKDETIGGIKNIN